MSLNMNMSFYDFVFIQWHNEFSKKQSRCGQSVDLQLSLKGFCKKYGIKGTTAFLRKVPPFSGAQKYLDNVLKRS